MKYKYLIHIDSPADLKNLTLAELVVLAEEVRDYIIQVVSVTGGHLASSLGAVDLAIALHYVFDSPNDKIIWDVGHQAYAHKILTGRREAFATNRCWEGISGFPRREESPHDVYGTGHASTSISAGYGLVCARDRMGEKYAVISVIGDGSLTGGLAFEGLNNAGASRKDFIVVLNDNQMSISTSVGALHNYLTMMLTHPTFSKMRDEIWDLTGRLPSGTVLQRTMGRIDKGLKAMMAPAQLFQSLGFRYLGPANGHNIESLVKIFQQIKQLHGCILLHILTQKGKGYKFAEEDSTRFHGLGAFDKMTGLDNGPVRNAPTYTTIFGRGLVELAEKDEKIIGITAAMAEGTGLAFLKDEFPDRFYDVGIAEGHAVTFAAGLAVQGFKPVVAVYSTFLQRAYDHIIHDVAIQKLPIVFIVDRAGLVGEDGPTHHGCFDLSFLRLIPGIVVMAPRNENELRDMLYTAIHYNEGPIFIRYPRSHSLGIPLKTDFDLLPVGKGEILKRGKDIAIVGLGTLLNDGLKAGELLEAEGISPTIVDMKFLKPLDLEVLKEIASSHRVLVTVEENAIEGGFGSAILENIITLDNPPRVIRLGLPDRFLEHGPRQMLLNNLDLNARGIADAVKRALTPSV